MFLAASRDRGVKAPIGRLADPAFGDVHGHRPNCRFDRGEVGVGPPLSGQSRQHALDRFAGLENVGQAPPACEHRLQSLGIDVEGSHIDAAAVAHLEEALDLQ